MSEDDNIFREVDQDLRREELAKLWDKYGIFVLLGAFLIVAVIGGYNAYGWWLEKQSETYGTAFYQASQLAATNENSKALAAFEKLSKEAPTGYRLLADLRIASLTAKEGRKAEAVALFEKIAQKNEDATLRDYAILQAVVLRSDEATPQEMKQRLKGLNAANNPWRYSAKELLGLVAFRSGDTTESQKLFKQIQFDEKAPHQMRIRAGIILSLLAKTSDSDDSADKKADVTMRK
jgi:hypothetical protein